MKAKGFIFDSYNVLIVDYDFTPYTSSVLEMCIFDTVPAGGVKQSSLICYARPVFATRRLAGSVGHDKLPTTGSVWHDKVSIYLFVIRNLKRSSYILHKLGNIENISMYFKNRSRHM